jgi:hypothetical protein
MKNSAFKYAIAFFFLLIFSGAISLSVSPVIIKICGFVSWQKNGSENDSSDGENSKDSEIKEFVGEITDPNFSLELPGLPGSRNGFTECSFTRTFYAKVPTPPPDHARLPG